MLTPFSLYHNMVQALLFPLRAVLGILNPPLGNFARFLLLYALL